MLKRLIFFCFFFVMVSQAITQPAGNSHVQQYTTDNGLPSNGIKGLQWDEKTGFLWIATEAGIVRFNGVDFRSYTKENTASIAYERMLFIVRNNAGKIYTSDQPGNIFFIDKSKPVLWRKTASNNSINPYLRNYYLLGVSDIFFKKNADSLTPVSFSAGFNKIICSSDTSCLILNQGTLFFYSISLKEPVMLSLELGSINTVFKIYNSIFITNNKKETFLFNVNDQTLAPVSVRGADGNLLKPKTNNSIFFWQTGMANPVVVDGEMAWLLTYNGITINAELIVTGSPADSYIRSIQYSEKNKLLFIRTESKGLIVINQNRVH